MSWLERIWGQIKGEGADIAPLNVEIPGWRKTEEGNRKLHIWRDADGDVLSLTSMVRFPGLPALANEKELRKFCRNIAQRKKAGLVEAAAVEGVNGPGLAFIYKRLERPAFVFTGMLVTPMKLKIWVWTMVAGERGITGIREAIVTNLLIDEGKLTLETYETSWAQDPYDSAYAGVSHSTLRYISDDESYDSQFPHHPLSKVRREMRKLLDIQLDYATF